MPRMIHSKYGYEPPEWVQADAQLDKWYKDKKRRAKQHGAFSLENKAKAVYQASQGDGFKLENKG
ncbi:hypothetical protein [Lactiplantibacillus plantarum]|uniref:hypothetical protein n=1 Tax=Lactiplantibacillus plantarum TaxID=1590 RepID=UPI0024465F2C|nr:hypothetical protein [Lactiplantibacillus plantarum]MDG6763110.1 hypothetical protein [Lactiplantibacillus plantarum]MDH2715336.1 hypothetical protein [Lactiplantibacillus plantarum]MDH7467209.1 hypothetical protein [Lactiplantibacillus plantarum]MDN3213952.1 hypothetical protein [Lactiplantibacillus plantarum]MDN3216755.1 hypothetical protein [Lactiplantibacillus plantarum]